jgi:hypothetical protein
LTLDTTQLAAEPETWLIIKTKKVHGGDTDVRLILEAGVPLLPFAESPQ